MIKETKKHMQILKTKCNNEKYRDSVNYKNYHDLPKICLLLYTVGNWFKYRLDEVQWSNFNKDISKNLGVVSAILRLLVRKAIQEPTYLV